MALRRREFLKIMGGATAAIAFPSVMIQGCKRALKSALERTPVIWIQAQSCSGCSVSLLNKQNPNIVSVITEYISLNFHQTIMGGQGDVAIRVLDEAVKKNWQGYVLIVEGSIPTKSDEYCTIGELNGRMIGAREWIEKLAKNAKAIVTVGTCAAYGGIPAANDRVTGNNPTGARPVSEIVKDKTIVNIPGCPPHPDWIIGTLLHLLFKDRILKFDDYGRPLLYYGKTVHEKCEHLTEYKMGIFAEHWGDPGCLYQLGCLGMDSGCDIPVRKWLEGMNSCTGCGAGCIGCTESDFPDYGKRGIFKHVTASLGEIKNLEHAKSRETVLKLRNGGIING